MNDEIDIDPTRLNVDHATRTLEKLGYESVERLYKVCTATARIAAQEVGYAVGEHGSKKRDLDLIACPWTDDAISGKDLAEHVRKAILLVIGHGYFVNTPEGKWPGIIRKPHGRVGYTIMILGPFYIDLSVMPRLPVAIRDGIRDIELLVDDALTELIGNQDNSSLVAIEKLGVATALLTKLRCMAHGSPNGVTLDDA